MKSNTFTGILKLVIMIMLFFIIWSILAIISTTWNPYGPFNFGLPITSENRILSQSILSDIIASYFSFFTISHLLLLSLVVLFCYFLVRNLGKYIFSYSPYHSTARIFFSRLFAFNGNLLIDLSNLHSPNSLLNSHSITYGPAQVIIPPYSAAIIQDKNNQLRIITVLGIDNNPVIINSWEKLIEIIDIKNGSSSINIKGINLPFSGKRICLKYRYLTDKTTNAVNNSISTFVKVCNSGNYRMMIESIIQFESLSLLNQYQNSLNKNQHTAGRNIKQVGDNNSVRIKRLHRQFYYVPPKNKLPLFLTRNRKRHPNFYNINNKNKPAYNVEKAIPQDELTSIVHALSRNVDRTMIHLFGSKIIEIVDYQIGGKD